jgi:hypothetical protein
VSEPQSTAVRCIRLPPQRLHLCRMTYLGYRVDGRRGFPWLRRVDQSATGVLTRLRVCAAPKLSRVEAINTTFEAGPLIKKSFEDFLRSLMSKKA